MEPAVEQRIKWIECRGRKVLYKDYSNLEATDLLSMIKETENIYVDVQHKILLLLNFENTVINTAFLKEIIRIGNKYKQQIERIATIGLSANQMVLAEEAADQTNMIARSRFYNCLIDAKDYLTS